MSVLITVKLFSIDFTSIFNIFFASVYEVFTIIYVYMYMMIIITGTVILQRMQHIKDSAMNALTHNRKTGSHRCQNLKWTNSKIEYCWCVLSLYKKTVPEKQKITDYGEQYEKISQRQTDAKGG